MPTGPTACICSIRICSLSFSFSISSVFAEKCSISTCSNITSQKLQSDHSAGIVKFPDILLPCLWLFTAFLPMLQLPVSSILSIIMKYTCNNSTKKAKQCATKIYYLDHLIYYATTMLLNTGAVANNNKHFPWQNCFLTIPRHFPDNCQIPWHFQVFQTSGHLENSNSCKWTFRFTSIYNHYTWFLLNWPVVHDLQTTVAFPKSPQEILGDWQC